MTVPVPVKLPSNNMADLAYPDIQAYLKECDMVLVPMASTEQHGPHLPLCTDTVTAIEVASRVAKINNMLHTPAIWTGYSPQHMAGPGEGRGTITIRSSTLQALMYDVARSLIHHGFNKILFINGHGSNVKVVDPVLRKIRYDTGAMVGCVAPRAACREAEDHGAQVIVVAVEGDFDEVSLDRFIPARELRLNEIRLTVEHAHADVHRIVIDE